MSNSRRSPTRPFSVWITQVLLFLGGLQMALSLLLALGFCLVSDLQDCLASPRLTVFLAAMIGLGILWITFRGLQRRRSYGQWLAVGLLVLGMVNLIGDSPYFQLVYRSVSQGLPLPEPPYECWQNELGGVTQRSCGYSSYLELILLVSLDLLPSSLAGILALRLAHGRAARQFFQPEDI
ncbi:MAG: hypothetical protein ACKO7W_04975 [Elainella sp.]